MKNVQVKKVFLILVIMLFMAALVGTGIVLRNLFAEVDIPEKNEIAGISSTEVLSSMREHYGEEIGFVEMNGDSYVF